MLAGKRSQHRKKYFTQFAVFVFIRSANLCRQPQKIPQPLRGSNLDGSQEREWNPHIASRGEHFEIGTNAGIAVGSNQ